MYMLVCAYKVLCINMLNLVNYLICFSFFLLYSLLIIYICTCVSEKRAKFSNLYSFDKYRLILIIWSKYRQHTFRK